MLLIQLIRDQSEPRRFPQSQPEPIRIDRPIRFKSRILLKRLLNRGFFILINSCWRVPPDILHLLNHQQTIPLITNNHSLHSIHLNLLNRLTLQRPLMVRQHHGQQRSGPNRLILKRQFVIPQRNQILSLIRNLRPNRDFLRILVQKLRVILLPSSRNPHVPGVRLRKAQPSSQNLQREFFLQIHHPERVRISKNHEFIIRHSGVSGLILLSAFVDNPQNRGDRAQHRGCVLEYPREEGHSLHEREADPDVGVSVLNGDCELVELRDHVLPLDLLVGHRPVRDNVGSHGYSTGEFISRHRENDAVLLQFNHEWVQIDGLDARGDHQVLEPAGCRQRAFYRAPHWRGRLRVFNVRVVVRVCAFFEKG